jgi:hypothetical protein
MKKCENCFEQNTDGATHCVICGEPMPMNPMGMDDPIDTPFDVPALIPDSVPVIEQAPVLIIPDLVLSVPETVLPPPETVLPPPETVLPPPEAVLPTPTLPTLPTPPIKAALEIYHDSENRVIHTYDIMNDITLVGREDPQRDVFPDLDLAKLESQGVPAKNVSREHLRLLRQGNHFFVFIFRGTTGTQINKDLIPDSQYGKKFEIKIGDRIVLGGKVRMKLVAKA